MIEQATIAVDELAQRHPELPPVVAVLPMVAHQATFKIFFAGEVTTLPQHPQLIPVQVAGKSAVVTFVP